MLNKVMNGGPSTRLYHFLVTPQSLASSMVIMKKRKVWLRAVSWIIKLMGVYAEGFVFGKWYGAKPLAHDYVLKAVYKDAFNLLCSNFLSSGKPLKSFGVKLGIVFDAPSLQAALYFRGKFHLLYGSNSHSPQLCKGKTSSCVFIGHRNV